MNYVVTATQADLTRFSADIDADIGYPKAGTRVGGGIHVEPLFVTQRHGDILKHPSLSQWAYPDDAPVVARRGRVPLPASATSKVLPADWFPAPPAQLAEDI